MSCSCFAHNGFNRRFDLAGSTDFSNSAQASHASTAPAVDIESITPAQLTVKKLARDTNTHERYLIKGGFLYAADTANTVIANSWVLVTGDKITAIGNAQTPIPEYNRLINAEGKLVLPGLVNPHWHESFVAPNNELPDDSALETTPYARGGNIETLSAMFAFISTVGQKLTLGEALPLRAGVCGRNYVLALPPSVI